MELLPFKYPIFTAIAALLALLGDALALGHYPISCAFAPAMILAVSIMLVRLQQLIWPRRADAAIGSPQELPGVGVYVNRGWRSQTGFLVCALLCSVPVIFFVYAGSKTQMANSLSNYDGRALVVQGRVVGVEQRDKGSVAINMLAYRLVFPSRRNLDCPLRLVYFEPSRRERQFQSCVDAAALSPGAEISAEIRGPSGRSSAANRSLTCLCHQIWCSDPSPKAVSIDQCGSAVERLSDVARTRLVDMHQKCIGKQLGDLLSSMVLGDKAVRLENDTVRVFRDVGLSHVLAASGFNLTVVIAMTYFVGRFVLRSDLLVHALCVLNMFCFVCLAGASASVMRAAIMCCVMLALRSFGLRAHLLAVMAIALLVTLVQDANAATDVGLQLSYAATTGIVLIAKPVCSLMAGTAGGLKKWFAETLAVVLASQSAVLPIQLTYFWQIGLMFVPANLVVTPILAPVTILGFSSSTIWMICPNVAAVEQIALLLCRSIDWLAVLPLQLMLNAVRFLASFDEAKLRVGPPSAHLVVFYVIAWLSLASSLRVKRHRLSAGILYLTALALLIWRPPLMCTTITCLPGGLIVAERNRDCSVICLNSPDLRPADSAATLSVRLQKTIAFNGWHIRKICSSQQTRTPFVCDTADATIIIANNLTAAVNQANCLIDSSRTIGAQSKKPTVLLFTLSQRADSSDYRALSPLLRATSSDYLVLVGPQSRVGKVSRMISEDLWQHQFHGHNQLTRALPIPGLRIVTQTVQAAATIPISKDGRIDRGCKRRQGGEESLP